MKYLTASDISFYYRPSKCARRFDSRRRGLTGAETRGGNAGLEPSNGTCEDAERTSSLPGVWTVPRDSPDCVASRRVAANVAVNMEVIMAVIVAVIVALIVSVRVSVIV
jgi:hypothetical protein